mmetsp:Transcript_23266/g.54020  ORF Transcript_23266/g.54020 Transcript_23266/m.54020 type:complete len:82 (-) Transcript_23266:134-379(-)
MGAVFLGSFHRSLRSFLVELVGTCMQTHTTSFLLKHKEAPSPRLQGPSETVVFSNDGKENHLGWFHMLFMRFLKWLKRSQS